MGYLVFLNEGTVQTSSTNEKVSTQVYCTEVASHFEDTTQFSPDWPVKIFAVFYVTVSNSEMEITFVARNSEIEICTHKSLTK